MKSSGKPKSSLIASLRSQFPISHSLFPTPYFAILLLFLAMLAASWQRWTQPLVDHGREMNLPARILAGERLYSDVQFLYGPFAPHFNALLYGLFGIHLSVLKAAGAVCAILILLMIYRVARALMSEWESFLVTGLVLAVCALKSSANYIQPYAYAALYGLVFALGSLSATISYLKRRSERPQHTTLNLILAGLLAGLSVISKPETSLTCLAAGFTALVAESVARRKPLWRDAALFAAPVIIITAGAYAFILSRTPLGVLLNDNHVLFTAMPPQLVYFNSLISGLGLWPSSLWFSLAGLGSFALWVGGCGIVGAIASRKLAEWRGVLKAGLIVAGAGALWRAVATGLLNAPSGVTPFASAFFVLPVFIGLILWDAWRRRDGGTERQGDKGTRGQGDKGTKRQGDKETGGQRDRETGRQGDRWASFPCLPVSLSPCLPVPLSLHSRILLVILVFGFFSILRAILNVPASGPYAPFFLPTLIIVYLYLLFRVAPGLMAKTDSIRENIRRAAMAMIALMIVGMLVNSTILFRRRNTFTVSSSRGSFMTAPEIGEPLQAAIRYVEQRTGPDDYVLSAPQGTTVNFLAARRYPLFEEIIHPGFLAGDKELDAIKRIEARKTSLILIANFDTSEFKDRAFGVDYNQRLTQWVTENYRFAARFDSPNSRNAKLGDKPFFILVYERNP